MLSFLSTVVVALILVSVVFFLFVLFVPPIFGLAQDDAHTEVSEAEVYDLESGLLHARDKPVAQLNKKENNKHVVQFGKIKVGPEAARSTFSLSATRSVVVTNKSLASAKNNRRRSSFSYEWLYKASAAGKVGDEERLSDEALGKSVKSSKGVSGLSGMMASLTLLPLGARVPSDGDTVDGGTDRSSNPMRVVMENPVLKKSKEHKEAAGSHEEKSSEDTPHKQQSGSLKPAIKRKPAAKTGTKTIDEGSTASRGRYPSIISALIGSGGGGNAMQERSADGIDPGTVQDKKRRQTARLFKSLRRTGFRESLTGRDSIRFDVNQAPIEKQENPIRARKRKPAGGAAEDDNGVAIDREGNESLQKKTDGVQVMHERHVEASRQWTHDDDNNEIWRSAQPRSDSK